VTTAEQVLIPEQFQETKPSMSEPFRVASDSSDVSVGSYGSSSAPTSSSAKSTLEPGLYTFPTVKGYPYGIKHFNLKQFYESGNYPDMVNEMKSLDEYVYQKAKERGLKDADSSYQEIVDEILGKIGKSSSEETYNTFKRVSAAVQAMQRMSEAKLPVNLDLENLTSKEIEDTSER
jgi:hypothetical protein